MARGRGVERRAGCTARCPRRKRAAGALRIDGRAPRCAVDVDVIETRRAMCLDWWFGFA